MTIAAVELKAAAGLYRCPWCRAGFREQSQLDQHFADHANCGEHAKWLLEMSGVEGPGRPQGEQEGAAE